MCVCGYSFIKTEREAYAEPQSPHSPHSHLGMGGEFRAAMNRLAKGRARKLRMLLQFHEPLENHFDDRATSNQLFQPASSYSLPSPTSSSDRRSRPPALHIDLPVLPPRAPTTAQPASPHGFTATAAERLAHYDSPSQTPQNRMASFHNPLASPVSPPHSPLLVNLDSPTTPASQRSAGINYLSPKNLSPHSSAAASPTVPSTRRAPRLHFPAPSSAAPDGDAS